MNNPEEQRHVLGLWYALNPLETVSRRELAPGMEPLERPVEDAYECAVEVPTLPHQGSRPDGIRVAGLYLKRLLNDLRSVWLLASTGYSAQAGSVAAAAFENAMIVNCVASDDAKAETVLKRGESPWSVSDLCTMYSRQERIGGSKSRPPDSPDPSRVLYAHYQALCALKHPSLVPVLHGTWPRTDDNLYMIMAAPDTREEDVELKSWIIVVTAVRVVEATKSFAKGMSLDEDNDRVRRWRTRLDGIEPSLDKVVTERMDRGLYRIGP